jgi:threonine/homoserine/homoserine lactone efflux protein|tara:strand:- start:92 stop:706 length:615 start_codon:yes stop_codon:yes gene_type:complete
MFPVNYFLYLQIIIFLFITPGTPRIVIVSHSVNFGVKKCLWTALGDISANTIQMILVVFVIGGLFSNNPQILNILKWVGVGYLFYLAYDTYNSKISSINSRENNSKSIFSFFKDGFLVAGTSPKAWAFFPLIFPQFLDFNSNYHAQFLILMLTYVILDFASLMGYALVAEKIVKWLKTNPRTINTISACVLIVIAFVIAVTQNY